MREFVAALPSTEAIGLTIFSLIVLAFMISAGLAWWKERRETRK
jgi:hypothetical protein